MLLDLDSAEAVTKYLRSKSESLDDILALARTVVSGSASAYLPGANTFVLDLLVDRFNENGSGPFKQWIHTPDAWLLLLDTFREASDQSRAARLLRRLHLIDVACTVFSTSRDPLCWEALFSFFSAIENTSIIIIDHATATNLLGAFCDSLSKVEFDPSTTLRWTAAIILLYRIPLYNSSATRKSYTKFAHECAPKLLAYLAHSSDEPARMLKDLLVKEMFNPDMIVQFKQAVKHYVEKSDLPPAQIETLFQITIEQMAASNISECEEVFKSITTAPQYAHLSENLLLILSSTNKTLSFAFLSQVYAEKSTDPINWTLINYLVLLDSEIGMANAPDLFHRLASATIDDAQKHVVAKSILNAFLRARELPAFFLSVWVPAVPTALIFASAEFVQCVSAAVTGLSALQIGQLLELLCAQLPNDSVVQPIVAVLRGIMSSPQQKTDAAKKVILESSIAITANNDNLWEIRYCILCLYGDCLSFGDVAFKKPTKYAFYTLFRLSELTNSDDKISQNYPQFVELLRHDTLLILPAIQRWSVFINRFFDAAIISMLIDIMLLKVGVSQVVRFLSDNGDVIYEQPKITHALVKCIASEIDLRCDLAQIVALIPVQCIDKFYKTELLDRLLTIAIENSPNTESALLSIKHILVLAPFKSKLETDLASLKTLVGSPALGSQRADIASQVWNNHLSQYGVENSMRFIDSSIEFYSKSLDVCTSSDDLAGTLPVLLVILKHGNEQLKPRLQQLAQKLVAVLVKSLESLKITEKTCVVATFLVEALCSVLDIPNLPESGAESNMQVDSKLAATLQASIIRLDRDLQGSSDPAPLRAALFKLTTRVTAASLEDAKYISALFLALESKYGLDLLSHVDRYISRLSINVHDELYNYILGLAEAVDTEFVSAYMRLLLLLIRTLKKAVDAQPTRLFNRTLSVFVDKTKLCLITGIGEMLETLKTCLCDQMWLFDQHAIETTLVVVNQAASVFSAVTGECEAAYISATQVVAHILLFHRYKLSLRHHLLLSTHTSLLQALCVRNLSLLCQSVDAAEAYSRLLSNLCEPSNTSDHKTNGLNTAAATIKRSLRKFVPILLTNYVHLSLKFNFAGNIVQSLTTGMFKVFDVLSQLELQLVSASLDVPGKTYFKTLYNDYKEHGKWHDT